MFKLIGNWLHEAKDEVRDTYGRELNIASTGILAHTVWDVLAYLPDSINLVIKVVLLAIGVWIVCQREEGNR